MQSAIAGFVLVAAGLLAASGALSAQHATAFDIEDGGRAFRNSCANCHGPEGGGGVLGTATRLPASTSGAVNSVER